MDYRELYTTWWSANAHGQVDRVIFKRSKDEGYF